MQDEKRKAIDHFCNLMEALGRRNELEKSTQGGGMMDGAWKMFEDFRNKYWNTEKETQPKTKRVSEEGKKSKASNTALELPRKDRYQGMLSGVSDVEVRKAISKVQYCCGASADAAAAVLASRLSVEGVYSTNELLWLLSRLLCEVMEDEEMATDFVILFGTKSQSEWLPAYVCSQLRWVLKEPPTCEEEEKLLRRFCQMDGREVLLLLSQRLADEEGDETVLELEDIHSIIDNSQSFEFDSEVAFQFVDLDVEAWPIQMQVTFMPS